MTNQFLRVSQHLALLLLAFFMSTQLILAQNGEEDVVYLKNGSEIRGRIIEQIPGDYLKIEILGGSIFVFQMDEVKLIAKEDLKYTSKEMKKKQKGPITFREKGIYNLFSFQLGFGRDRWDWTVANPSLQYTLGYRFNRFASVGVGTGLDPYDLGLIMPFFLDFRGDVLQKRATPHYFLDVGYGVATARGWNVTEMNGGLYSHVGVGYKLHTRRKAEWIFGLGYKYQSVDAEITDAWWGPAGAVVNQSIGYQRITFQTAVSF